VGDEGGKTPELKILGAILGAAPFEVRRST
jgi:hypothetical protein